MFKLICGYCGWSKGETHLPEVYDICDECAEDEMFDEYAEDEMFDEYVEDERFDEYVEDERFDEYAEDERFDDEVVRYDGLR